MARHNRDGRGSDQRGFDYEVSYQPDWFHLIKVTRTLETGRQSTKTLFRNPTVAEAAPGPRVRTRVVSREQGLDFEVVVQDPGRKVRRLTVETFVPGERGEPDRVVFTVEDQLPPAR